MVFRGLRCERIDEISGTIDHVLAVVAPGQGAQTPGFLTDWLASTTSCVSFADRLGWLSAVSGLDLAEYGTNADAEAIRDTAVAQPLLVAAAITASAMLFDQIPSSNVVVAGHSVGEIAAACLAGVLTPEQAMVFVASRGKLMAEAAALTPTGMSAVLRGDRDEVLAAIERHGLTPANNNGEGQIVAAGSLENLEALANDAPAGARVRPLSVAGAFHTSYMGSAVDRLRALTCGMTVSDPVVPLLSNRDGKPVDSGRDYLNRLVNQVANPVRWDLCMDTMQAMGVTGLIELVPAGTLTGIAKRSMSSVELFKLNTVDQLDQAQEFCARHTS